MIVNNDAIGGSHAVTVSIPVDAAATSITCLVSSTM